MGVHHLDQGRKRRIPRMKDESGMNEAVQNPLAGETKYAFAWQKAHNLFNSDTHLLVRDIIFQVK
jgi:hypothetical protein